MANTTILSWKKSKDRYRILIYTRSQLNRWKVEYFHSGWPQERSEMHYLQIVMATFYDKGMTYTFVESDKSHDAVDEFNVYLSLN